jgi:hypothetical protein
MRIPLSLCALLVLAPLPCLADGLFRCGSWVVSADISIAELENKCGAPTSRTSSTQDVLNPRGVKVGTSTTQVWRYDRGDRSEAMLVTIVDGHIQSIDQAP